LGGGVHFCPKPRYLKANATEKKGGRSDTYIIGAGRGELGDLEGIRTHGKKKKGGTVHKGRRLSTKQKRKSHENWGKRGACGVGGSVGIKKEHGHTCAQTDSSYGDLSARSAVILKKPSQNAGR